MSNYTLFQDRNFEQVAAFWQNSRLRAAERRLEIIQDYHHDFTQLDLEFENISISISYLLTQTGDITNTLILDYLDSIPPYLKQRGLNGMLLDWCNAGIKTCEQLSKNTSELLLLRSEAFEALGRWDETMSDLELTIQQTKPDTKLWGQATFALGRLQLNQGDYKKALPTLDQAEKYWRGENDPEMLAYVRAEIAAYYLNNVQINEAHSLYMEVDQLHKKAGATESTDHLLLMLGVVHRRLRDYDKAISYLRKLLERYSVTQNPNAVASASHHLAWVYLNQGDLTKAHEFCVKAIAIFEDMRAQRGLSDAYEQLGLIFLAEGDYQKALEYMEQSHHLRLQIGNQHGTASCLRHLGTIKFLTGQRLIGAKYIYQSLYLYWRLGVLSTRRLDAILQEFLDWVFGKRRWTV